MWLYFGTAWEIGCGQITAQRLITTLPDWMVPWGDPVVIGHMRQIPTAPSKRGFPTEWASLWRIFLNKQTNQVQGQWEKVWVIDGC